MKHFKYTARSNMGEETCGKVTASNMAGAVQEVERLELVPIAIAQVCEADASAGSPAHPAASPPPIQTTCIRPWSITLICVLGFVAVFLNLLRFFYSDFGPWKFFAGEWERAFHMCGTVVALVCFVGLFDMRKWAVFVYTGFAILGQFVMLTVGVWHPFTALIPGVVIVFGFIHLSKMR